MAPANVAGVVPIPLLFADPKPAGRYGCVGRAWHAGRRAPSLERRRRAPSLERQQARPQRLRLRVPPRAPADELMVPGAPPDLEERVSTMGLDQHLEIYETLKTQQLQ